MKKFSSSLLLIFTLLLLFFSCKKEDSGGTNDTDGNPTSEEIDPSEFVTKEPVFEPIDPSTASSNISVSGGTRNTGTPPASTSTAGTPVMNVNNVAPLRGLNGRSIDIDVSNTSSDVQGVYLQVDGASDYIDAPASSSTLRTAQSTGNLTLDLGESLPWGKFCVSYCVYDSQNRVSEPVTVCIEVQQLGGNPNLVGEWLFQRRAYYTTSKPYYSLERGKNPVYDYSAFYGDLYDDIPDYDPTIYEPECESSETIYDALDYTFNADGTASLFINETDVYYDDNCNETDRYNDSENYEELFWSYDATSNTISLLEEYDGQYYAASYIYLMNVKLTGNKLTLLYGSSGAGFLEEFSKK